MENEISTTRVALKWGAIVAVASIILSVIINVLDLYEYKPLGYLAYLFLLGGIVLGCREYLSITSAMSFGQGMGIGVMTSAISGAVSGAFTYVYVKFIDPSIIKKTLNLMEKEWEKAGISEDQIDMLLEQSTPWITPNVMFVVTIFMFLLFGVVFSLIVSAIMKKEKPFFV
jgi:hypothetical protein